MAEPRVALSSLNTPYYAKQYPLVVNPTPNAIDTSVAGVIANAKERNLLGVLPETLTGNGTIEYPSKMKVEHNQERADESMLDLENAAFKERLEPEILDKTLLNLSNEQLGWFRANFQPLESKWLFDPNSLQDDVDPRSLDSKNLKYLAMHKLDPKQTIIFVISVFLKTLHDQKISEKIFHTFLEAFFKTAKVNYVVKESMLGMLNADESNLCAWITFNQKIEENSEPAQTDELALNPENIAFKARLEPQVSDKTQLNITNAQMSWLREHFQALENEDQNLGLLQRYLHESFLATCCSGLKKTYGVFLCCASKPCEVTLAIPLQTLKNEKISEETFSLFLNAFIKTSKAGFFVPESSSIPDNYKILLKDTYFERHIDIARSTLNCKIYYNMMEFSRLILKSLSTKKNQ